MILLFFFLLKLKSTGSRQPPLLQHSPGVAVPVHHQPSPTKAEMSPTGAASSSAAEVQSPWRTYPRTCKSTPFICDFQLRRCTHYPNKCLLMPSLFIIFQEPNESPSCWKPHQPWERHFSPPRVPHDRHHAQGAVTTRSQTCQALRFLKRCI